MELIADDLNVLSCRPAHAFNSYLAEGVLFDAGTRWAERRILREVNGHPVDAHVISHAHCDHQGSSASVVAALGIPVWAPAVEAEAVESGDIGPMGPDNLITRIQLRTWAGPGVPVDRRLREGDEVAGFTVLETPGHSPGHLSFWRERDRALLAFDVIFGRHPITGRPGLFEPPDRFTIDPARNRDQIRRLASLEPELVCFGHGPPLRGAAGPLRAFADSLSPVPSSAR
jgi:glyoxylase-like metal-dependent hydrolase (beta-lactamase superfamily II)